MDQKKLEEHIKELKGKIGFYYENMEDGTVLTYNEDEIFTAASVIKLPMFMWISKLAYDGKIDWHQKVTVKEEDKAPSCGALLSFNGDVQLDIESLCRLMITLSDNTATNVLINTIGIEELQKGFLAMGLEKTRLERRLFNDDAAAKGLENKINPKEIAMLLKKIYNRTFVSPEVCEKIEEVLLLQQIRHKIPGYIGRKKKIANKTGESTGITHDSAIVFAQKPFVLVVASENTDVPQTERFIRETALKLYVENGEGE